MNPEGSAATRHCSECGGVLSGQEVSADRPHEPLCCCGQARSAATRFDQYRDTLEAWALWWNNVGRHHYRFHIVPPITMLNEALFCTACAGVGPYEAETGPERCQVCGRRVP